MKYCSKCGAQNEDSNSFCMQCGEAIESGEAENVTDAADSANVAQEQPNWGAQPQQPFQTATPGANLELARPGDGLRYIRQIATSNLFLIAVILFSASIVFTFWNSVTVSTGLMSWVYSFLRNAGYASYIPAYAGSFLTAGTSAGSAFFSAIPSIVNAIGLWLIYTSAKDVNVPGPGSVGFTILKVMTIISLVGTCVFVGVVAIIILIMMFAGASYLGSIGFVVGMLFILLIMAAFLVLMIFYYRKLLAVIKSAVSVIQSGGMVEKPSMYLIVWIFIMAFFGLSSLFTGFLGFIAAGSNIAFLIIMALILLNVKKDVENAEAGFSL